MPEISVIIPVYNSEKYLEKCLYSIIYQTFKDIEIICINDGSKDNSLKILDEFKNKDKRIKVITTKNKGQSAARNLGINTSEGNYISFIDSDDWVSLSLYQKFIEKINLNSDIFLFNARKIYEKPLSPFYEEFFKPYEWKNYQIEDYIHTFDDSMNPFERNMSAVNKIYKKSFLIEKNIKFAQGLIFEDQLFYLQTMLEAEKIYMYKECLYNYGINNFSTMKNINEKVFDIFKITELMKNYLVGKKVYEEYKYAFLQHLWGQFSFLLFEAPGNLKEEFFKRAKFRLNDELNIGYDNKILTKLKGYKIFNDFLNMDLEGFFQKYKDKK